MGWIQIWMVARIYINIPVSVDLYFIGLNQDIIKSIPTYLCESTCAKHNRKHPLTLFLARLQKTFSHPMGKLSTNFKICHQRYFLDTWRYFSLDKVFTDTLPSGPTCSFISWKKRLGAFECDHI